MQSMDDFFIERPAPLVAITCQRVARELAIATSLPQHLMGGNNANIAFRQPSTVSELVEDVLNPVSMAALLDKSHVMTVKIDSLVPEFFPMLVQRLINDLINPDSKMVPMDKAQRARYIAALLDQLGVEHRAFSQSHWGFKAEETPKLLIQQLLSLAPLPPSMHSTPAGSPAVAAGGASPSSPIPTMGTGAISSFVSDAVLLGGTLTAHGLPPAVISSGFGPFHKAESIKTGEVTWSVELALLCCSWTEEYFLAGGKSLDLARPAPPHAAGSFGSGSQGGANSASTFSTFVSFGGAAAAQSSATAAAAASSAASAGQSPVSTGLSPRKLFSNINKTLKTQPTLTEGNSPIRAGSAEALDEDANGGVNNASTVSQPPPPELPFVVERFPSLVTIPSAVGVSCAALAYGAIPPSTVSTLVQWLHQAMATTFSPIPACALTHVLLLNHEYVKNFLVSGSRFFEAVIVTCCKLVTQAFQPTSAPAFDIQGFTSSILPVLQLCVLCSTLSRGKLLAKDTQIALGNMFLFVSRLFINHIPSSAMPKDSHRNTPSAARFTAVDGSVDRQRLKLCLRMVYRCVDMALHDYKAGSPEVLRAHIISAKHLFEKIERRANEPDENMDLLETMIAAADPEISAAAEEDGASSTVTSLVGWLPASGETVVIGGEDDVEATTAVPEVADQHNNNSMVSTTSSSSTTTNPHLSSGTRYGMKLSQKLWTLKVAKSILTSEYHRLRRGVPFSSTFPEMDVLPGLEEM